MKKFLSLTVVGAALVCLGYSLAKAIPPAPKPGDGEPEALEVRYARAEVALAEASLKRISEINKRVNRAVSGDVASVYDQQLDIARLQLQAAEGNGASTSFDVWLRRAESAASYARSLWRGAAEANRRTTGAVDPLEVERLHLTYELAKLELERGQATVKLAPEAKTAWELEFLNGQVQRALEELRQSTPTSRVYLFDR